jgi:hypothetical protein
VCRSVTAAAVALVSALGIAACGGSGSSAGGPQPDPTGNHAEWVSRSDQICAAGSAQQQRLSTAIQENFDSQQREADLTKLQEAAEREGREIEAVPFPADAEESRSEWLDAFETEREITEANLERQVAEEGESTASCSYSRGCSSSASRAAGGL